MGATHAMGPLEEWLSATSERPGKPARPLVTLSYAQSLDGSIAARRGESYALSGPQSMELTHRLRARHDAILVGVGTVLSDDPQLNVRLVDGRDPQIVVFDSKLRFPLNAKMLAGADSPIIFCSSDADTKAAERLSARGLRLERQRKNGRVDVPLALRRLGDLGVKSVMVEGGGEIIASFLDEGLVDRAVITIAPMFLHGYKIPATKPTSLKTAGSAQYGADLVIWGEFVSEAN